MNEDYAEYCKRLDEITESYRQKLDGIKAEFDASMKKALPKAWIFFFLLGWSIGYAVGRWT